MILFHCVVHLWQIQNSVSSPSTTANTKEEGFQALSFASSAAKNNLRRTKNSMVMKQQIPPPSWRRWWWRMLGGLGGKWCGVLPQRKGRWGCCPTGWGASVPWCRRPSLGVAGPGIPVGSPGTAGARHARSAWKRAPWSLGSEQSRWVSLPCLSALPRCTHLREELCCASGRDDRMPAFLGEVCSGVNYKTCTGFLGKAEYVCVLDKVQRWKVRVTAVSIAVLYLYRDERQLPLQWKTPQDRRGLLYLCGEAGSDRRLPRLGSLQADPDRRLCKYARVRGVRGGQLSGTWDQGRTVSDVSQAQVLVTELSLIWWCGCVCVCMCECAALEGNFYLTVPQWEARELDVKTLPPGATPKGVTGGRPAPSVCPGGARAALWRRAHMGESNVTATTLRRDSFC